MAEVISLEQGKRFQMGKGDSRHLVSPDIGAQSITMNYSIFQPGHEFPQHFHDESADIFIVLEGGVSVRQGDQYTPIQEGDFAYIPPGEVHGTVNTTAGQSILISFQAPPDGALYRGDRDPSKTGSIPTPPPNHISKVQIRQLASGEAQQSENMMSWHAASPATGTQEMRLTYYEIASGGQVVLPALAGESVWFVWEGNPTINANDTTHSIPTRGVAFVPPGESQTIVNDSSEMARLIHCEAVA